MREAAAATVGLAACAASISSSSTGSLNCFHQSRSRSARVPSCGSGAYQRGCSGRRPMQGTGQRAASQRQQQPGRREGAQELHACSGESPRAYHRSGDVAAPARFSRTPPPQREHRVALAGCRFRRQLRRLLVQARPVLRAAQLAVGVGGGLADAGRQQPGGLGALQQRDVADVGEQLAGARADARAPGTAPRTRRPSCRRGCA